MQKTILDNEKAVDRELMVQISNLQSDTEDKKKFLENLKDERAVLMESEENLVGRIE
jgi:hypothetical protein